MGPLLHANLIYLIECNISMFADDAKICTELQKILQNFSNSVQGDLNSIVD